MTATKFGLCGIGNALVDILAPTTDAYLDEQDAKHGMKRGSMNLIDEPRAIELYGQMGPAREVSGGSAANTMAAYASLGGKGAYIGKVRKDQLGAIFAHDMKATGIYFGTPALTNGPETGRCMILYTPHDGQRTMNTFLGAAVELTPDDIDDEVIAASEVTYLEGYLYDPPLAMQAFQKAAKIAHKAGRKVSLSLSDPFCVARHRDDFLELLNHVDILFGNEEEIKSLYQVDDWNKIPAMVKDKCEIVVLTRSEKGSVIFANGETTHVAAEPVAKVVDTTGAGDAYAAGFLYGYTQGLPMAECGRIASIAAAEVIAHVGPRPEVALADLITKKAA